jgi:signal transduction histidine kinase
MLASLPVVPNHRTRQRIAYICAIVLPFASTWATIRMPAFHTIPFTLHFACIAGIASLGGFGPALLAVIISVASFNYHVSPPYNEWSFSSVHYERAAGLFSAASFLIFLSWKQRRTEARLRATLQTLHQQTAALINSEKLAATGRMTSTIAHEINNPLEPVTNLLYLARNGQFVDETTRSYLALAEEELARLSNITRLTLSFVRSSPGRTPVDVGEVLETVLTIFRRRCELLNITVERTYTPGLRIEIYEHELRQVATNLVSNAIDALNGHDLGANPLHPRPNRSAGPFGHPPGRRQRQRHRRRRPGAGLRCLLHDQGRHRNRYRPMGHPRTSRKERRPNFPHKRRSS